MEALYVNIQKILGYSWTTDHTPCISKMSKEAFKTLSRRQLPHLSIKTASVPDLLRYGIISMIWTVKTILMQIHLIWIKRLPEGYSKFRFKITVDTMESHPHLRNLDWKQFRYSGVDTADNDTNFWRSTSLPHLLAYAQGCYEETQLYFRIMNDLLYKSYQL